MGGSTTNKLFFQITYQPEVTFNQKNNYFKHSHKVQGPSRANFACW